jgi:hypothetical protein
MTGALTYAANEAHLDDLRAAAAQRRQSPLSKPRGKRRLPARPGQLRPRRALAA